MLRLVTAVICVMTVGVHGCDSDNGGGGATPAETFTYERLVIDMLSGNPVEGVEFCLMRIAGTPDDRCATTGADGVASFADIAEGAELQFSMTADGYQRSMHSQLASPNDSGGTIGFMPSATAELMASGLDVELDRTKGVVGFEIFKRVDGGSTGIAGVTISLSATAGTGPYYFGEARLPDPELTATTTGALAIFLNVPPGDYVLTASGVPDTCANRSDFDHATPELEVVVEADTVATVSYLCE